MEPETLAVHRMERTNQDARKKLGGNFTNNKNRLGHYAVNRDIGQVFREREIIMMSHRDERAAETMIEKQGGRAPGSGSEHRPTSAEVAYRIATMTAVIFLLASVV
jgi:hypothetical protein